MSVCSHILTGKLRHNISKGFKIYVINICLYQSQSNDKMIVTRVTLVDKDKNNCLKDQQNSRYNWQYIPLSV